MNPPATLLHRSSSASASASVVGSADAGAWPELDASVPAGGSFARRHIGPGSDDVKEMLQTLGFDSLEALVNVTVPQSIRMRAGLRIGEPRQEFELLQSLKHIAAQNRVMRSLIGLGYYDTITPTVIQRNILENPGWYTQYTPYQAEIAQGRLEALLNFQTMISDLTALPLANASLLDEGTAAAEAMNMCHAVAADKGGDETGGAFFVADDCFPQSIAVVKTRAKSLGIQCVVGPVGKLDFAGETQYCGLLLQYPSSDGSITDYAPLIERAHAAGAMVVMAADVLALTLIKPPGEMGADIAVGSTQRFGVPMGFGGPHAAYMATRSEFARKMPGRIVGVSRDSHGDPAYRLSIQTREQHIRREKATSNICTAQVLLAVMASMYGVYHGPRGLRRIALRVHRLTRLFADRVRAIGHEIIHDSYFDTLTIRLRGIKAERVLQKAIDLGFNLRPIDETHVGVSLDQTVTVDEVRAVVGAFALDGRGSNVTSDSFLHQDAIDRGEASDILSRYARASAYLTHPVFNRFHSETEMLRYIRSLEARDLSLTHSMIPLGSCTMKLNATTEMIPVTWEAFGRLHPYAPADQTRGYASIFADLEKWLAEITGFSAVSLQPNAGSQGEYAGLLAIRAYHESRGDMNRDVCLIPVSAHGTNPSSAVIAGFKVVPVACDARGNIEVEDLRKKAAEHAQKLGALMITYPSTHGVFEEEVSEICKIVHANGGQVYMDGANMNAQVGLCRPGDIGADVCHLNLHKTFCIPHGGGGPGMGPIAVAPQLARFLPGDPLSADKSAVGAVSAANFGSASILLIPWVYISLMGGEGLTRATQVAILNANYMAKRLGPHYPILFKGQSGRVAHEFVMDARQFESRSGIKVEDIAKRLMDYGFHAPTMSWPVPGTMMIEPTESESRAEMDRFCDAMIAIREEIRAIEQGKADKSDNVLKNAPHTATALLADEWKHPYGRTQAAYPLPWVKHHKFWPAVGRIDNPWGDRNLVCTCPPMSDYESLPKSNDQT